MLSTEAVRAKSLSASNKWASAKEIAISACLWYRKRTNRVSMPTAADTDTVFQSTLWYRSPLLPSNYSTIMLVPSGQFPPHSLTVISAFVLYCLAINGPLSAFFFFWNSWERKKNTFVSHFTSPVPGLTSTTHTSRQIHTATSFIYLKWGSQSHFCSKQLPPSTHNRQDPITSAWFLSLKQVQPWIAKGRNLMESRFLKLKI